ncbi:helix-turn-helix domain-containing protein [Cytobacillus sp. FSL R7-0696]|uniref:IclR family transcriptional regulator n=1 Tax=Cytobacillus sp. FSL R7-0696 TaxID=2921691 RepID=UPI0030F6EA0D
MEIQKSSTMIQSLQIGISIIELIYQKDTPMKFSTIQEETGITKSNLYKYLNTLTQLNMLYREKGTNLYYLGSKLIQYGTAAFGSRDIADAITPYMQELSSLTSCTVSFSLWTNNGPITTKICHSNEPLHIGTQLGGSLPPTSAAGKIFLSFLNPVLTKDWLGNGDAIDNAEWQMIQQSKISFATEPLIPSISSASVPLLDYQNQLLGAVTVVGFNEKMPKEAKDSMSKQLLKFHLQASSMFGYRYKQGKKLNNTD